MNSQKPYLSENPELHISQAVPFFRDLGIPQGFSPILTKDTKPGMEVYLMGSTNNPDEIRKPGVAPTPLPAAYGPHKVATQQQFPARIWLENSKGTTFPVQQEELLVKHEAHKETPWGPSQKTTKKGEGIWFHSTSSHGGIELSPDNQDRLMALFPKLSGLGCPQWLEEDEDAHLAVLAFPKSFSPENVTHAFESLRNRRDNAEHNEFEIYLASPTGLKAAEITKNFASSVANQWECGGSCTCYPKKGVNLFLRHRTTGESKTVYFEGEYKSFYTDEELGLEKAA